jgi:hypothetical protein
MEGRLRKAKQAVSSIYAIKPLWKIFNMIRIYMLTYNQSSRFKYNRFSKIKNFYLIDFFKKIINYNCHFEHIFGIILKSLSNINNINKYKYDNIIFIPNKWFFINKSFDKIIYNYYLSNLFCYHSKVLTQCALKIDYNNFNKTYSTGYKIKI